jgi:predicted CXXCH cytochrome family protein
VKRLFGHGEHLVRVFGLFAAGLLLFLLAKALLVPADFGVYGHYRAGALADNRAEPLVHAGRAACAACHAERVAELGKGKHAGVGCESCHGPLAAHAAEPKARKAQRPDGRALCLACHRTNVARPPSFSQVDPRDHAPEGACTDCHSAHDPGP